MMVIILQRLSFQLPNLVLDMKRHLRDTVALVVTVVKFLLLLCLSSESRVKIYFSGTCAGLRTSYL